MLLPRSVLLFLCFFIALRGVIDMGDKYMDQLLLRHMLDAKNGDVPDRASVYRSMRKSMQVLLTWLVDADSCSSPFDFRIFTAFVSDQIYFLSLLEVLENEGHGETIR